MQTTTVEHDKVRTPNHNKIITVIIKAINTQPK